VNEVSCNHTIINIKVEILYQRKRRRKLEETKEKSKQRKIIGEKLERFYPIYYSKRTLFIFNENN